MFVCVALIGAAMCRADEVKVTWQNWDDDHLYDSNGLDMRLGQCRFQVVLDMSNDTDVAGMISSNYWGIGAEDPNASLFGADDDVTIEAQNTNWTVREGSSFVYGSSRYDETAYASKRFYFRFFNAADAGAATEAGLIYSLSNQWMTADSALNPVQADANLGRVGAESAQIAGSTDGTHLDGWATMSAAGVLDADGDGLPDAWENWYFEGTNATYDGHGDADDMSNGDEYTAGTDPTNTASVFAIDIVPGDEGPVVQFTARSASGAGYEDLERYYDLEYRSNLVSGSWLPVAGCTNILGQDHTVTHTNTHTSATLYRARAELRDL